MADVRAMCAIGLSGQLGLRGQLPWEGDRRPEFKADAARFFDVTRGHVLLAGPRTVASVPAFAKADRTVIAIRSGDDPQRTIDRFPGRVIYIGGGPPVWSAYAPFIRHWDITRLPYDGEADRWFDPAWLLTGEFVADSELNRQARPSEGVGENPPMSDATSSPPARLTLTRPDDWHLHLRDGAALAAVVGHSARQFARAIVMPNLKPPITTTALARAYRERILAALPAGSDFEPLMTLYLTDNTSPAEIRRAREAGVAAVKYYPAGATTNSDAGVTDLAKTRKVLEAMQREGLPLLVHGEVTDAEVDLFDREAVFIDRQLIPLRRELPELKIVFEHITTREGAQYVLGADAHTAATVTPQHLLYNRNAIFTGGLRPHFYCLPVLKAEVHRQALVTAATSGSPKFFLGTDSAPHAVHLKEHASGHAGCYTAFSALELYAEAFEAAGALDKLEGFASFHGPDFYGLPRNTGTVSLRREAWTLPASLPFGDAALKPLRAGEPLAWRLLE